MNPLAGTAFSKLEALGNDFVLLDHRAGQGLPTPGQVQALADRHSGIGFDQLLILQASTGDAADCRVRIFNADGSPATQCGNGMRAIALWLGDEAPGRQRFVLETDSGLITIEHLSADGFRVDMGRPDFDPTRSGLSDSAWLQQRVSAIPGCLRAGTVSMGNPHLVLLLTAPLAAEVVAEQGRQLATDRHFTDGANISFATRDETGRVLLQVYERGVGPTRACGSAACASAAFLIHHGLLPGPVEVDQPGGRLVIDWRGADAPLFMTGPARRVYDGTLK